MNTKVKKFFWRNSFVGVRVRLAFLWALALTAAVLLAGLAPLPSIVTTVALCVAIVLVSILFGVWTKKGYEYFSITWGRMVPFPTKARHYIVPAVAIGLLVLVPTLWISADAKWGEGFHEVMRGLGYSVLGLAGLVTLAGIGWVIVTSWQEKSAQAKLDRWNEIQAIRDGYEAQLAQAAKREAALKEQLDKIEDRVHKAFSGDFIRLLAELTLERQTEKKPDKFRGHVRETFKHSLEICYGKKVADEIIRNNVWTLMGETNPEENSTPPVSSDIQ